jgi:HAD superfamily hydrolase (TIGR01484 family)
VNQPLRGQRVATTGTSVSGSSPEHVAHSINAPITTTPTTLHSNLIHFPQEKHSSMENILEWFELSLEKTAPGFQPSANAGEGVVFSLDYDGTLAPAGMPHSTTEPQPGVTAALERLIASGAEVWLTSGKDVEGLHHLLPVEGIKYCGLFGLEYNDGTGVQYHPDVKESDHENIKAVYDILCNEFSARRYPKIEIEQQGSLYNVDESFDDPERRMLVTTLVWKACSDDFDHLDAIRRVTVHAHEFGLEVNVGHGYVNVVPFLPGKGDAVRQIITRGIDREITDPQSKGVTGRKTLVCVGDEAPDLASFREAELMLDEGLLAAYVNLGVSQPVYDKVSKNVYKWGPTAEANTPHLLTPRPFRRKTVFLETGSHDVDPSIALSEDLLSEGHMVLPGPRGVAQFLTSAARRLEQPFVTEQRMTIPIPKQATPLGRGL